MPQANDTVQCPTCGRDIVLEPHPTEPGRLVAYCKHDEMIGRVTVLEMPGPQLTDERQPISEEARARLRKRAKTSGE